MNHENVAHSSFVRNAEFWSNIFQQIPYTFKKGPGFLIKVIKQSVSMAIIFIEYDKPLMTDNPIVTTSLCIWMCFLS